MVGLQCQQCGCMDSVCVRTTSSALEIVRRRRCIKCGSVFKSVEVELSRVPDRFVGDSVKPETVPPPASRTDNRKTPAKVVGESRLAKALASQVDEE